MGLPSALRASGQFALGSGPARSLQVERVFLQRVKRYHGECLLMRRGEHNGRGNACLVGLTPRGRTYTPAIAGLETRKVVFGHRRDQIVALRARKLEELGGHLHADDMQAVILGPGVATTVAVETGAGCVGARGQRSAEDVFLV